LTSKKRRTTSLAHVRVEVAEVLHDRVVRDGRVRTQEPGAFHRAPEPGRVGVEHDRLDEPPDERGVVGGEALHEPEVEEGHMPVGPEQVVARVRVTVEQVQPVEGPEHEAEDRLAREVPLVL